MHDRSNIKQHGLKMMLNKKLWLLGICVSCILILLGLAGCTTTTPITSTNSNTTTMSGSTNGLSLSLSLGAISYQPSREISIIVDEKNMLSTQNNVLSLINGH